MLIFPLINDLSRKIIHVDMDAFFAAIEVRDSPALKGKPVIIGADPRLSGGRGVVSTCNYEARAFGILASLPVEKFHGVGKKTVERLHEMGVYTGQDLLDVPEMVLIDRFGRFGFDLYRKARGISNSPVKVDRVRKSSGKERTYRKLLYREEDVLKELISLCQRVAASLKRNGKKGRTIVLKVRYGDFSTLTKRHSLEVYTDQTETIEKEVRQLIEEIGKIEKGIRLLGVTVTNFQT